MKTIHIKSNTNTVIASLESYTGEGAPRTFEFTVDRFTIIPMSYALTLYSRAPQLFATDVLTTKTAEALAALEKGAVENYIISEEELNEVEKFNKDDILATLKGNNFSEIKKLLVGPTREIAQSLLIEHKEDISSGVVNKIVDEFGINLNMDN